MNKSLSEIAQITYGADYKKNHPGDRVPIYGTGGRMGYTSVSLNTGPAVLSGRKGSINNPIYVEGEFWNVDTIFCIKTVDGTDTKWLFYNFQNTDLQKLNEATGVPSISASALKRLSFKYFDLPIQRKIAHILSTIDRQIAKTEAIITKYQAVKQGMLQDLFTRGINIRTGQLRPRYEDAPDLYQDSPLGMIPKEWEVVNLGVYSKVIDSLHKTPSFVEHGIPMVRVTDVKEGYLSLETCNQVDEATFKTFTTAHVPQRGDLIISRVGSYGVVSYNNDDKLFCLGQNIALIHPYTHNAYMFHFLTSICSKNQIENYTVGSSQKTLSLGNIKKIDMPISSLQREMEEISQRIDSIKKILNEELKIYQKLQLLKQGMMQDLLSGKVEVRE